MTIEINSFYSLTKTTQNHITKRLDSSLGTEENLPPRLHITSSQNHKTMAAIIRRHPRKLVAGVGLVGAFHIYSSYLPHRLKLQSNVTTLTYKF